MNNFLNDSLSLEHKEEIHAIFHKSIDLLRAAHLIIIIIIISNIIISCERTKYEIPMTVIEDIFCIELLDIVHKELTHGL